MDFFIHTNVHISLTDELWLMPRKICENFRKSQRPTVKDTAKVTEDGEEENIKEVEKYKEKI